MSKKNIPLTLCLTSLLLLLSCKNAPEDLITPDGVRCANLPAHKAHLLEQNHPLIIQGTLHSLPTPQASLLPSFISTAHAYALEQEKPLPNQTISLYYLDLRHPTTLPEPALSTTTNKDGKFCIAAPSEPTTNQVILLQATPDGTPTLRHIAPYSFHANINATSEALTQLVIASPEDTRSNLSNTTLLNLQTLAESRVGLLSPVKVTPDDSQKSLIQKISKTLQKDPQIQSLLKFN